MPKKLFTEEGKCKLCYPPNGKKQLVTFDREEKLIHAQAHLKQDATCGVIIGPNSITFDDRRKESYRLINVGEKILPIDEYYNLFLDRWESIADSHLVDKRLSENLANYIRRRENKEERC